MKKQINKYAHLVQRSDDRICYKGRREGGEKAIPRRMGEANGGEGGEGGGEEEEEEKEREEREEEEGEREERRRQLQEEWEKLMGVRLMGEREEKKRKKEKGEGDGATNVITRVLLATIEKIENFRFYTDDLQHIQYNARGIENFVDYVRNNPGLIAKLYYDDGIITVIPLSIAPNQLIVWPSQQQRRTTSEEEGESEEEERESRVV
ncbi:MAG: hypothetical protein QXF17_06735 [Ignisphaera sp.]